MKLFNVNVPANKVSFMAELLDGLGLEWSMVPGEGVGEAPAGVESPKAYELDEEARKKAAKVREESLKDVISRIEAMRKK